MRSTHSRAKPLCEGRGQVYVEIAVFFEEIFSLLHHDRPGY